MKAVVKDKPGLGITVSELPPPVRSAEEILVRVDTAGICGSDLHAYEWIPEYSWLEPHLPTVLGHEIVGTVLETADGVGSEAVTVGTRVAVRPAITCGFCQPCQRGESQHCIRRIRIGYERNGGLASLVTAPAQNAYAIPSHVDDETASLIEPLTVAVHAVGRTVVRRGSVVGVVGAGAIGLLGLQVLRARGATDIVLVGTNDDERGGGFQIARELGAVADVAKSPTISAYQATCEVVLVAAGARAAVASAMHLVAPGGTVVAVGLGVGEFGLNVDQLVRRESTFVGAFGSVPSDWLNALDLMRSRLVIGAGIVSHHYSIHEALAAFELLSQGRARKVCIHPNR